MVLLDITTKTNYAEPLKVPPLLFQNASQYKPIKHYGHCDSDPELIILNNQISSGLKMPFEKKN